MPEARLEDVGAPGGERTEELVGERLASRDTYRERGVMGAEQRCDRAQEVRLADARRTADEQRVVRLRGHLCDRERSCVRKAVAVADHELLEGELRVPARRNAEGRLEHVGPALAPVAVRGAIGGVLSGDELHDR